MALATRIEGTIVRVMETFPLQLVISAAQGDVHAPMREDTEVRLSSGAPGNLRMLRPGVKVRFEGNVLIIE
jgi:hypothetical protein